jgi:HEPN domain-containing protein
MPLEEDEVKRWFVKATHDWSAVVKLIGPDCAETDVAAFHCQQAIEKTLKAYLVSKQIPFEKSHDLGRLLDHCLTGDADFECLRDDVEPLTIFAVAFRYPGPADPTVEDVTRALAVVERVWKYVVARVQPGLDGRLPPEP